MIVALWASLLIVAPPQEWPVPVEVRPRWRSRRSLRSWGAVWDIFREGNVSNWSYGTLAHAARPRHPRESLYLMGPRYHRHLLATEPLAMHWRQVLQWH